MNSLVAAARTVLSRSSVCSSRSSGAALTSSTFRSPSSSTSSSSEAFFSTSTSSSAASDALPPQQQPSEAELEAMLRKALPGSKEVSVKDTSGGCGTMYEISVSASEFAGVPKVKQHRLVAAALPVKSWHGFVLHTSAP